MTLYLRAPYTIAQHDNRVYILNVDAMVVTEIVPGQYPEYMGEKTSATNHTATMEEKWAIAQLMILALNPLQDKSNLPAAHEGLPLP